LNIIYSLNVNCACTFEETEHAIHTGPVTFVKATPCNFPFF